MARPKKPASEKTVPLMARFRTLDEIPLIKAAAAAEGIPIAAYIHRATMEYTKEAFEFDGGVE